MFYIAAPRANAFRKSIEAANTLEAAMERVAVWERIGQRVKVVSYAEGDWTGATETRHYLSPAK